MTAGFTVRITVLQNQLLCNAGHVLDVLRLLSKTNYQKQCRNTLKMVGWEYLVVNGGSQGSCQCVTLGER